MKTDRQSRIRQKLKETEKSCNTLFSMYREPVRERQADMWYDHYVYYQGRRRFFLKELLRVQLKEFNQEG